MDTISQAANIQMAKDVHFIAAPFRHIWHLIIVFVLLMLAPIIVTAAILGLVFGKPLTELEIVAVKLLMWAFGHIVFAFWFMLVTRHLEVRRNGGSHEGLAGAYVRTLLAWVGSFVGTTLMLVVTRGEHTPLALLLVAVGTVSPALFYCVYRLDKEPNPGQIIWRKMGGICGGGFGGNWYYQTRHDDGKFYWHPKEIGRGEIMSEEYAIHWYGRRGKA